MGLWTPGGCYLGEGNHHFRVLKSSKVCYLSFSECHGSKKGGNQRYICKAAEGKKNALQLLEYCSGLLIISGSLDLRSQSRSQYNTMIN